MSKQKIREWLVDNYNKLADMETADIIHQYTKDHSAWVSVKDKQPLNGVYVAYRPSAPQDNRIATLKYNDYHVGWSGQYPVTHWQPLPLPPTQEG